MNNTPNTATPQRHHANFGDLARITHLPPDVRRKMMATIASKSEKEQLYIFKIKKDIAHNIKTSNREQIDQLKTFRERNPITYDYYMLLLALTVLDSKKAKSEYISMIREMRQDPPSFKTSPKEKAIQALIPLIDELKAKGGTYEYITDYINNHKRKMLSNRKISVDYLKKVYYKTKKAEAQNIVLE